MTQSEPSDRDDPNAEILEPEKTGAPRRATKTEEEPRVIDGDAREVPASAAQRGRFAAPLAGFLAGLAGAGVVALVLWRAGVLAPAAAPAGQQLPDDLMARLQSVEQRGNATAEFADAQARDLEQRLDLMAEALAAAAPDDETDRLAALTARLAALENAGDDGVSAALEQTRQELNALAGRFRAMESRLAALESRPADAGGAARAALGLALANLTRAVDAGEPFAADLAALRRLWPGVAELSLAGAQTGVASMGLLRARFDDTVAAILTAERQAGRDGFWDRLAGNAASLVTVRRTGDVEGADLDAIVARMEAALKRGDLRAAVAEGAVLEGPAAEAARSWLEAARARLAAQDLIGRLSAEFAAGFAGDGSDPAPLAE